MSLDAKDVGSNIRMMDEQDISIETAFFMGRIAMVELELKIADH